MSLSVDVFWSFRSPYSYLATWRMTALEKEWNLKFNIRPVYPIAVRLDGFFKQANPMWLPYLVRDVMREAQRHDTPFMWPRPDPIVMDFTTGEVAKEQPYIHRLTRLGVAAAERGRGLPFVYEVSTTLYGGKVENWHQGSYLAEAASRAGVDLREVDEAIAREPDRYEAIIKENEAAHKKAGHWGVPTFAFEGEPFFGQDRIDALIWRLKQHGLTRRAN
ncbi:MAG: 2-hydroxychromene-2-carboxylate isomerase [Alphaproteobacteria bacterium]|nr:2-hydroxychromene-2-carboxylate isomerase [Alphaproteobacteria bacterium]